MSPQAILDRPLDDESKHRRSTAPTATFTIPEIDEREYTVINILERIWAGITGVLLASTGIRIWCASCGAPEQYAHSEPTSRRWDAPLLYTCTICDHTWLEPSWFWHIDS